MLAADQLDLDAIMAEVERDARELAGQDGRRGVSGRVMLTAGRPLMQAVVHEIERRTPPLELVEGLAPLIASAISTVMVNTNLAAGGKQFEYALDTALQRIGREVRSHVALSAARADRGKDTVRLHKAGRA